MKLLNFTLIKLTLCLILGIVMAHYFKPDFDYIVFSTIGFAIAIGIYWVFLKSKINRSPYFGLLTYTCMVGIGIIAYNIQDETLQSSHYSHILKRDKHQTVIFKIREHLKPDAYNNKYIVSVKSFNDQKALGKLLVNIKKDTTANSFAVDDMFFTSTLLEAIQKPLNPHQFDYSNYLKLRQVHHQIYLQNGQFLKLQNNKSSIYGLADNFRNTVNTKLIAAGFEDDVLSIINALLLGQRQAIDKTVYSNYVNSGTIHILAVSGLHVGILLLILNFIFSPLLYLKKGNYIRFVILFIALWTFAVIAGLSPSVTRAVTMFSIISFAMHLRRPTNIYNTLTISAFFILLVKPTFLFEVGFQMSYLAVLGIVSIQPLIYKLWQPKYWFLDKPWQIFTVTLAAQFGVVPISLFYFHQFPGLFFISNLVVIPFLGLILGFGLLVIFLALTNQLYHGFVIAYSFIIDCLNGFIGWVAGFQDFLITDIPFSILQVIFSYVLIVAFVQLYKFRNFKWLFVSLFGIIAFQCLAFYQAYSNQDDAFVIFNKSRYTIIGHKQGEHLTLHHNLDSVKLKSDNVIKNYTVGETIDSVALGNLQPVYRYKNETLLVVDSLSIYKTLSFKPDYILLRNSPRLNLNRVIDSLGPKVIIADASNYKSYIARWKLTCLKRKIPFHITNEKGAFILK